MQLAGQLQALAGHRGGPLPVEQTGALLGEPTALAGVGRHHQDRRRRHSRRDGVDREDGGLRVPRELYEGVAGEPGAADDEHADRVEGRTRQGDAQGRPPPALVGTPPDDGVQARQGRQAQGGQAQGHGGGVRQQRVQGQADGGDDEGGAQHPPSQRLRRRNDDRQDEVGDVDEVDAEAIEEGDVQSRGHQTDGAQDHIRQRQGPGRAPGAEHAHDGAPVGGRADRAVVIGGDGRAHRGHHGPAGPGRPARLAGGAGGAQ